MDIEILNPDRLRAWCQRIQMPAGAVDSLDEIATTVCADPAMRAVFEDFHQATAQRGEWHREWDALPMDPAVTEMLGKEKASLFYLLGYLAALPYTEQAYRRLGIPLEIFDATMTDLAFYTNKPYQVHGQWQFREFMWIWRHLACELFRLGRMQYMYAPFEGHVTAFRSRQDGSLLLLSGTDIPLRPDGCAQGAGLRSTEKQEEHRAAWRTDPSTWFATFEEREEGWRGNPVHPIGTVQRETVFLPRAEWDCILKKGDGVLDLHIPRGQNLTMEDCRASLQQAHDFYARFWPERPFHAVVCHTWLFSPQLQSILPPESNIVRFQREFYLYPLPGGPEFLWGFVFGEKYPDPASAPRDTSLRRKILEWIEQGNAVFDLPGVLFHSPQEWGTQPYWQPSSQRP